MNLDPLVIALPAYFLLMTMEWIILKAKSMRNYQLSDTITNINCGVTSQVTSVFLKVLLVGLYTIIYERFRFATIPTAWWTYFLIFIGFDFCYYWMHRFSHEVNLFWAGHSVHHQSEEYNFSVALRQSSTQIIWTFFFYLPLALIGFDPIAFITVAGVSLLYQFWIHTELIDKMPMWFEFVFNTPSHHRVHHARNDKYIDTNHSGTLIIWDRIFGTFKEEEERPMYGTTKPINSWNPVWANFANYVYIIQDARTLDNWRDRFKLLFDKPGRHSVDENGSFSGSGDHLKSQKQTNKQAHHRLILYVISHFIFLLIVTAIYFLSQQDLTASVKLGFSAFIVLSVISVGFLLEKRRVALYVELIRMIVLSVVIVFDGFGINEIYGFKYLAIVVAFASLSVLLVKLIYRILRGVYEH